ncbi:MAG: molybdenum cofactor biosynthesis protein MoaE [Myxococcales bacterium]|nr:molybdenum cofactor biosynthesis protein MoaE [Myxococcales bacterium]MCB9690294.1 molybdenum cofactor biosynthesis protein MoaE [Alphaproteobacteria bacterium]
MIALVHERIDVAAVRRAVDDPGCGAVLVFEGVGRDVFEGRPVLALEYEAYAEMAVPEMERIAAECRARFDARVAMVHRTGRVEIGEPSVVIAVSTPHRAAAYEASRYAIDELKVRVPVWKKEVYADGSAWKANAPRGG